MLLTDLVRDILYNTVEPVYSIMQPPAALSETSSKNGVREKESSVKANFNIAGIAEPCLCFPHWSR